MKSCLATRKPCIFMAGKIVVNCDWWSRTFNERLHVGRKNTSNRFLFVFTFHKHDLFSDIAILETKLTALSRFSDSLDNRYGSSIFYTNRRNLRTA